MKVEELIRRLEDMIESGVNKNSDVVIECGSNMSDAKEIAYMYGTLFICDRK